MKERTRPGINDKGSVAGAPPQRVGRGVGLVLRAWAACVLGVVVILAPACKRKPPAPEATAAQGTPVAAVRPSASVPAAPAREQGASDRKLLAGTAPETHARGAAPAVTPGAAAATTAPPSPRRKIETATGEIAPGIPRTTIDEFLSWMTKDVWDKTPPPPHGGGPTSSREYWKDWWWRGEQRRLGAAGLRPEIVATFKDGEWLGVFVPGSWTWRVFIAPYPREEQARRLRAWLEAAIAPRPGTPRVYEGYYWAERGYNPHPIDEMERGTRFAWSEWLPMWSRLEGADAAVTFYAGLVARADRGTLFCDELPKTLNASAFPGVSKRALLEGFIHIAEQGRRPMVRLEVLLSYLNDPTCVDRDRGFRAYLDLYQAVDTAATFREELLGQEDPEWFTRKEVPPAFSAQADASFVRSALFGEDAAGKFLFSRDPAFVSRVMLDEAGGKWVKRELHVDTSMSPDYAPLKARVWKYVHNTPDTSQKINVLGQLFERCNPRYAFLRCDLFLAGLLEAMPDDGTRLAYLIPIAKNRLDLAMYVVPKLLWEQAGRGWEQADYVADLLEHFPPGAQPCGWVRWTALRFLESQQGTTNTPQRQHVLERYWRIFETSEPEQNPPEMHELSILWRLGQRRRALEGVHALLALGQGPPESFGLALRWGVEADAWQGGARDGVARDEVWQLVWELISATTPRTLWETRQLAEESDLQNFASELELFHPNKYRMVVDKIVMRILQRIDDLLEMEQAQRAPGAFFRYDAYLSSLSQAVSSMVGWCEPSDRKDFHRFAPIVCSSRYRALLERLANKGQGPFAWKRHLTPILERCGAL